MRQLLRLWVQIVWVGGGEENGAGDLSLVGGEVKTLESAAVTEEHTRDLHIEDKLLVT